MPNISQWLWRGATWAASYVAEAYARFLERQETPPSDYLPSIQDRVRLEAGQKLADLVPQLLGKSDCPYVLSGIPSWYREFAGESDVFLPPIDLMFPNEQLVFLLLPPYEQIPYDDDRLDYRTLENTFARRLNQSGDVLPVLPIFCDPEEILSAHTLCDLAILLNRAWADALQWGLQHLPPIPADIDRHPPHTYGPGSWVHRRYWFLEAQNSALFHLPYDVSPSE